MAEFPYERHLVILRRFQLNVWSDNVGTTADLELFEGDDPTLYPKAIQRLDALTSDVAHLDPMVFGGLISSESIRPDQEGGPSTA